MSTPLIQFRIGQLGSELAQRVGPGMGSGSVARRDLARYYESLSQALGSLWLTNVEWASIRAALAHGIPEPGLLWARVENASGARTQLVERLRDTTRIHQLAVIDAFERWRLEEERK